MFLYKATIGYGDEGLGMYAEVVKVLHVRGIKSVVCFHFRVYNNGEEDGNTNTFRKCHRGD